jgi:hypothetical protein
MRLLVGSRAKEAGGDSNSLGSMDRVRTWVADDTLLVEQHKERHTLRRMSYLGVDRQVPRLNHSHARAHVGRMPLGGRIVRWCLGVEHV